MTRTEYETELKALYGIAVKQGDVRIALELLERVRTMGFDDIRKDTKENEK